LELSGGQLKPFWPFLPIRSKFGIKARVFHGMVGRVDIGFVLAKAACCKEFGNYDTQRFSP